MNSFRQSVLVVPTAVLLTFAALNGFAAELQVPAKYAGIQAAVDAASDGDTIRIASGVYTNQVLIDAKKLTLIGQSGTILRATPNLSLVPWPGENHFPILYIRSSEVTLRGLIFEGERLAERFEGPGELRGVLLRAANASSVVVENCAFYGFREGSPGAKNATATALTVTGTGEIPVNLRVTDCTFADNSAAIRGVGAPNRRTLNITIENNTIIGPGPLERGWPTAGIIIREGVGGRIAGNTISGYSYTGTAADFDISFGIEASHQANYPEFGVLEHLEIEGNTLRDNQVHISLVKANGSAVRNNRFQGTAPGILPIGLALTGTNVTIARNEFEDMPEGIRLFGSNDPDFGDLLGSAIHAQVTGNRFCRVAKTIALTPDADATQQGTLLCPFPSPVLDIASAVLLSWPSFDGDYLVETAPRVDGPWSSSVATPSAEDGHFSVTVPATRENRFFRLKKP